MLSHDLYKNKYLKYKNKYFNLKSYVGGAPKVDASSDVGGAPKADASSDVGAPKADASSDVGAPSEVGTPSEVGAYNNDNIYFTNLIKYLNYTRSIFQYLDRFYKLSDVDVISIGTIRGILENLISPLIGNLTTYKDHLTDICKVIQTGIQNGTLDIINGPDLGPLVDLVNLDTNVALNNLKKTNEYNAYYWQMLDSVDKTITNINNLLTIGNNPHMYVNRLSDIITQINSFITKLQKELSDITTDRTIAKTKLKREMKVYETMEEKKSEERRQGKLNLYAYRELPRVLPEDTSLDSSLEPDYGKNLHN
jgi:hypothetical protein